MLQVIVVKIMDSTEKGLVGQTDKAYENKAFKAYSYFVLYISRYFVENI